MRQDEEKKVQKYAKERRSRKHWHRVATCLAAVVVFCTTYALILPAITMEKHCGLTEHTHTDACYTQVTAIEKKVPVCTAERLGIHQHTDTCYDADGKLICGQADYVVHHHDAACYDENGVLWCPLPETEAHQHTDSCYSMPEPAEETVHTHTDDCYTMERGALICQEHVHTDACYAETTKLICDVEESAGHQHDESCTDENGEIICGQECSEGHQHTEGCYETIRELTCGIDSNHQHGDDCYEWNQVLTCDLPTEPTEGEPVLICGEPAAVSHQHTDACFETVEEPVDTTSLTCTLPEDETHTHTALCYGTWELTCGLEEHVHGENCVVDEDAFCGKEAHTHDETCLDENGNQVCGLEEHTHTLSCYSDPNADVEAAEIWEQTFAEVTLTGDWRQDVIAIAETQLGYAESTRNYAVWEDGTTHGYTRYGDWYGSPYGDWCAMFASFCIHYAGVEDMPLNWGCRTWIADLEPLDRYRPAQGEEPYSPKVGDLIFYDWEGDGLSDHVGLVAELIPETENEPARLVAIEGNSGNKAQSVTYDLDDPVILGYGLLPEQEFFCGKTGHVHTARCGSGCPLEEHIHTGQCELPAEEETLTNLTFEGADYTVLVQYGPDAALPEGVTLEVSEISADSEEYRDYLQQANTAMEAAGQSDTVVFARFFDVRFVLDGKTLEPAAPVSVTITYAEPVETSEDASCQAIHFGQEGTEILDVTTEQREDGSTSFTHTQNGFSVVGNVVTRAIGTYANAPTSGLDHNVTFMVKIRDNWVNVGSCTYETSAVNGRNASVSEDVLHQYLDSYGYSTESNPVGTLKCSYDDIYTINYAQHSAATGFAVDIKYGSIIEDAYLHLWEVQGQTSQAFRIWRVVDNYYFLTPLSNSGLHVNLHYSLTDNETPLRLHSTLDEASWWGIRNNDDGTVSFYSQKKTSAYINLAGNKQENGTAIQLYEAEAGNRWKLVQKYDEQTVVAGSGRVGLTAESNGNIVCFYTPSTPLNDDNAIYTAEELSKLGTSGSYYLGCDITVNEVTGQAAEIGDGVSSALDLNGHTIHYNVPTNDSGSSMVYLHGTGSLTITDRGQAVETTEVVTDRPFYGNQANYDSSTKTLVYYVTESRPNGDGTTTETLVKHTVNLANVGTVCSETTPNQFFFVAGSASLNIQGGLFTNPGGQRVASAVDSSNIHISGGYLCGCVSNDSYGGAISSDSAGALTISGGVIAGNQAGKGGGVYKKNGTFTMTGGVVSGNVLPENTVSSNEDDFGKGGGVFLESVSSEFSGGYITNNRVDYYCGNPGEGHHFGGGIAQYGSTFTMESGAYLTGNYHHEAGGGIGFSGDKFIMTGGTVAANVAQNAEGGGIRIQDSSQTSLISGGYVTNNRTNSAHDWGGGGIFLVQGQSLQILNAVFQKNSADGFGGGVGGCSTGQIVAVDNTAGSVAIFDNHANGRTMSGSDGIANVKQDDLTARSNEVFMTNGYNDFFCALNSAVSGTMLGNGAENWHGSCDYVAIDIGKDQIVTANKMMGLNASPTDTDKQTAIQQGTVFVSGNYSQTHGGGIMSNGILILGKAKDITLSPGLEIEVYKSFKDANGNTLDQQPGQFQFLLQDGNHNTIATVSNNAYGMVLAEQDYTKAGTYTYYLKEQPGSNPLITYDSTEYQITVTVGTNTKTLNLSAYQSMTITYYVVTDIQVSLSSGTGTFSTETSNVGSDNHRATVVISKDGGTAFTNTMKEKPLYFRITKLNGHTNEPLQFVEFTLKDEQGNVVTSSKTDKDGHVSLQIEKGKNYLLYETTYKDFMPAGPWILEVDTEGNVIIYDTTTGADGSIIKSNEGTACTKEEKDVAVYYDHTITNLIGGYELPDTGGAGILPYTAGGLLLMAAAVILLYSHTKRRKEDPLSS